MTRDCAAVVIGAGVVGCSIALALVREGLPVTVVDREGGPGLGSTSASSAIVRLNYSTFAGVAVAWEAQHEWERWPDMIGVPDPSGFARYHNTGMLFLDTPGYDADLVCTHFDRLRVPYERLDAAQLGERFPYLSAAAYHPPRLPSDEQFWAESSRTLGALYMPRGGYVDDPSLAARNLWTAAEAAGAQARFRCAVTAIETDPAGVVGVALDDGTAVDAGIVVNAAGPHSGAINALAGVLEEFRVRTRPMRQEVHTVDAPPELGGDPGPAVGDGDLGTYFRSAPGGRMLVGGVEAECDPMEWLTDADDYDVHPSPAAFERYTLRLARRVPSVTVPHRPTGHAGVYDVSDDWIPIYDKTGLPGYFVAIGTSGNQFKNAPVIGSLLAAIVRDWLAGGDHDVRSVHWRAPITGSEVDLAHYSRLRSPNTDSSNSVFA